MELKPEDFDVLVLWPADSVEAREEEIMVRAVVALCRKHGYGRMTQIIRGVKDLMQHPDRLEEYRKHKVRFLELIDILK